MGSDQLYDMLVEKPDLPPLRSVMEDATRPLIYRNDSARLSRFCGFTRMMPPRGLSISAIRKKAIDT
ncbi:MAG TPA: hypothetical protein VK715_02500, partial [Steroidobacteraceae bacterium]|nr:hypothetical protein [Steroidobacteraceae bacterium]